MAPVLVTVRVIFSFCILAGKRLTCSVSFTLFLSAAITGMVTVPSVKLYLRELRLSGDNETAFSPWKRSGISLKCVKASSKHIYSGWFPLLMQIIAEKSDIEKAFSNELVLREET